MQTARNLPQLTAQYSPLRGSPASRRFMDFCKRIPNDQRKEAQLKKKKAGRCKTAGKGRGHRKKRVESESETEEEEEDYEESSDEEEADEHPRSSPIPPPAKRAKKVLEEVTNKARPVRGRGVAHKQLTAAKVSQTYAAPYCTSRLQHAADP
ncbi:hypothetical protein B0H16DRAFT_1450141 [Mycena metata]|uniref:Uncharacterized protein n=1 Tax=Mycena metata TaxID=1033252 RepID=A0AAD7NUF3_9AGAR|nr:hypothetical protein B0H16DRAFT_1450141 [Mycena metata]